MLYLIGNCHAYSLFNSQALRDFARTYRRAPSTHFAEPRNLSAEAYTFFTQAEAMGLQKQISSRTLLGPPLLHRDKSPTLIVINMFNERPLLRHRQYGYDISISDNSIGQCTPAQQQWLANTFEKTPLDHANYFDRYLDMLIRLRKIVPDVPILLLHRLGHWPAYGPDPRSLLDCWAGQWRACHAFTAQAAESVDNLHFMSMDMMMLEYWQEKGQTIDDICTLIRFEEIHTPDGISLSPQRDLDHLDQPFWDFVGAKIARFYREGTIGYNAGADQRRRLMQPYRPPRFTLEHLRGMLSSGKLYPTTRGLFYLFWALKHDFGELLVQCAEQMPVHERVLHMVDAYATLKPSKALHAWCMLHAQKTPIALQNREEGFVRAYLEKIDQTSRKITQALEHKPLWAGAAG